MSLVDLAPQLAVNGLFVGSLYALIAVSWGLIYHTTKVFHIAHALVFTIAAYGAVVVVDRAGLPLVVGIIAAVVLAGVLGGLIERFLYRPLRNLNASQLHIFLASLGLLFVGQSAIQIIFGPGSQPLEGFPITPISLGPVGFTSIEVLWLVGSWVLIGLVLVALKKTKYGRAIRAVGSNPELSHSFGVEPARVFLMVFILGSCIVAFAAVFLTLRDTAAPSMGLLPVIAGIISVFMGGMGSVAGAALGGLLLGLAENMGGLFLPGHWQGVIAFSILFLFLVIRPTGILGRQAQ